MLYKTVPEKSFFISIGSPRQFEVRCSWGKYNLTEQHQNKIQPNWISHYSETKTQSCTSEEPDIFMNVIKIGLANARTPFEKMNCVPFIRLSNPTDHLGLIRYGKRI